jgi:outer membrane protein OmpA-like peptidoglycan-associated protein
MRDRQKSESPSSTPSGGGSDASPGRRTLTGALPPVQREASATPAPAKDGKDVQAIAAEGAQGASGALPHVDRIQQLFGRHDVSGVKAQVGGPGAAAAQQIGAEAYAQGNTAVFAGQPSLHTAAHEAAHVVQQRAGVSPAGGVGEEGDAHERHADAVADRVVAGESAEDLLDQVSGGGGGGEAPVQAKGLGTGFGQALASRYVNSHGPVQKKSAGGVSLSNMRFTPAEIKDDGATTSQAAVSYSNSKMAGPATINWSIDGPAFGATVSPTGLITPGTDTVPITKDKVKVAVKAVDSVQAGANTTGNVTVWNRKFLQAKADYATFVGTSYKLANYHQGINGNFDATYNPARKSLGIEVRVAFNFVDDLAGAAKWSAATKRGFSRQFVSQVRSAWAGQYQFQNVAEPKLVWKKLNPISVSVNAKESAAAPHFTATVHKKQVTDAVHGATADFSAASQTPNKNPFPGTGAAELAALQAKTPSPILFAAGAAAIGAGDAPKVQFLGTYLHSVHQPKFQLTVTGHAAPDPAAVTPAQKAAAARTAMTLSRQRANAVKDSIRAAGNTQHRVSVVAKGDTAGVAAPAGDKVEIASIVDPSYVNVQPVLPHEFGHMLGLGDEYANAAHPVGANATHYGLAKDALGQDMADSFAKITVDAEGIMQGGKDVRPVHYVTMWAALADAAATAAVPAPPFGRPDWKFVGM